ncbi:MAG: group 1 truncated hemoglobin [Nitrospira sp. CG24A]|nr:MAG: group 1 truncated hemoglobin [Nitrospira sp. CG24A]
MNAYHAAGELAGITSLVDVFYSNMDTFPEARVIRNMHPEDLTEARKKLRGADGIAREKQLLIDFLCANSGGPMYYTGRDMKVSHKGMKISEADWTAFLGHANATFDAFKVPPTERAEVAAFVQSLKKDIVEA